ncbi:hypothetical protein BP5796_11869 [Coleophoma crateriformis]|uniref:Uncharacterized protein n=1 Tax=Coleophoma crateriformis TaxID=565419 RepID=A0A3D8QEN0_9HELO|nr:hypothetical protein BP5796_11869 [Coleophoma crateriformis]
MADDRDRKGVEILIHTGAPSRGQDDARYRSFARAFLDFEPSKRIRLVDEYEGEQTAGPDELADSQLRDELLLSTQERPGSESYKPGGIDEDAVSTQYSTQFNFELEGFESQEHIGNQRGPSLSQYRDVRRTSKSMVIESPQLSFNSIMDNADSPPLRFSRPAVPAKETGRSSQTSEDSSWRAPPSVVEESQPEVVKTRKLLSSPTRVLELYLQHFNTPEPSSSAPRRSGRIAARQATTCVTSSIDSIALPQSSNEQSNIQSSPPVVREPSKIPPGFPISLPTSADAVDLSSESPLMIRAASPMSSKNSAQSPLRELSQTRGSFACSFSVSFESEGVPDSIVRSASAPVINPSELDSEVPRSVQRIIPESPSLKRRHTDPHFTAQLSSSPEIHNLSPNNQHVNKRQCLPNALDRSQKCAVNHQKKGSPLKSTPPLLSATDPNSYYIEIRPPAPPASTADLTPDSLITKSLEGLAQRMRLPVLFRPREQTRPLRPLERGYWRVNWQLWTPELRERNWSCLSNYVGKGGAGWGVWCTRDDDFRMFRVYCWGQIVGHIYLLLYTSSESKIRGTGACWIDGSGEVVITMPS